MNRRRLEHTAREVLPFVEPHELNMRGWKCDTAACAFGHECMSRFGKREGLAIMPGGAFLYPTFEGRDGVIALRDYYELDAETAGWIFFRSSYDADPSPAEVASRIESLLASESP